MKLYKLENDFKHSGSRNHIDGVVLHSMAMWFNRDLLLQSPYNISKDLVYKLDKEVFAPDFLEFVGKYADKNYLKGSADAFIDDCGDIYEWRYDKKTWHAGKSEWDIWSNLNSNFMGIECMLGNRPFAHYGEFVNQINTNKELFSDQMYESLAYKVNELKKKYKFSKENIVTHKMVAGDHVRGIGKGKQDIGDAFDLGRFKKMIDND